MGSSSRSSTERNDDRVVNEMSRQGIEVTGDEPDDGKFFPSGSTTRLRWAPREEEEEERASRAPLVITCSQRLVVTKSRSSRGVVAASEEAKGKKKKKKKKKKKVHLLSIEWRWEGSALSPGQLPGATLGHEWAGTHTIKKPCARPVARSQEVNAAYTRPGPSLPLNPLAVSTFREQTRNVIAGFRSFSRLFDCRCCGGGGRAAPVSLFLSLSLSTERKEVE